MSELLDNFIKVRDKSKYLVLSMYCSLAVENNDMEFVRYITSNEEVNSINVYSLLFDNASKIDNREIVDYLLTLGFTSRDDAMSYILCTSAENGYIYALKKILKFENADPSFMQNYAIRLASANGRYEVVELLLKDGRVDPSARNNYAVHFASSNGHISIVNLLVADIRVLTGINYFYFENKLIYSAIRKIYGISTLDELITYINFL